LNTVKSQILTDERVPETSPSFRLCRTVGLTAIALGLSVAGVRSSAVAQTARDEAVQNRARPDFDAEGVYFDDLLDGTGRALGVIRKDTPRPDSASGLIVFPRLQLNTYYDDNVLRTPSNKHGDVVETTRASLDVTSDRDDHGIEFGGFAEAGYFARFVSENYQQYGGYVGGFLVPTMESRLGLRVSEEHLRQTREETGAGASQLRPNFYTLLTATARGGYEDADWQIAPVATLKSYTFDPNPPTVIGSEFDRDEWTGSLRLGHSVAQGSTVFIEPQINTRRYHQTVSVADGLRHDSSGYQILGGMRYDLSSVTYAEVAAGWLEQRYVDTTFPTLSGPTMAATAVWNPRDWITVTLDAARQVNESVLPGVSGIETMFVQGAVDYELDYNWLANATVGYATADYRGTAAASSRTDDTLRYGLGTRYLLNRRMSLGASWAGYNRTSTAAGAALDFNQYMATVMLQW
jgi:polysaccharide biosynthesis protein VpsM